VFERQVSFGFVEAGKQELPLPRHRQLGVHGGVVRLKS
jgi:hypothetical protein